MASKLIFAVNFLAPPLTHFAKVIEFNHQNAGFRQGRLFDSKMLITERPLQPGDVTESSPSFTANPDRKTSKLH